MIKALYHMLFIALTLLLFCGGVVNAAESASSAKNEDIALDFKNIELQDLIKTISELTGRNFVYDERVRGKVTIISPTSMSKEEAYQLFLTVLNVKGFTLVPSGKANKIVPLQTARQSNLPLDKNKKGESYITRLIHLRYAEAQTLSSTVLLQLIPKTSNLSVYAPTNTLILTDSAANIDRLVQIIRKLDVPSSMNQLKLFSLQDAEAEEVAKIANTLLAKQAVSRVKNRNAQKADQVIAYPRTNTLLVMASDENIALLTDLINRLDVPQDQERSRINVYYLQNADAEELSKTLTELTANSKAPGNAKVQAVISGQVSIKADKPTNSLLISAGPKDYELIKQVIKKLDIRRNQVYVEALILELSMNATREVGVSLQGAADIDGKSVVLGTSNLNTGSVGLGGLVPDSSVGSGQIPSLLTQTVKGLMLGGLFNPITTTGPDGSTITVPAISALIQLSEDSSDVNILSAPRLLTSDNEEAEIIVGSNVPIITNRLTDSGSNGLATNVAVERKDVALTLRFTPQVTEGNLVRLNVYQEITDIAATQVGDVNDVGPTLTKRQLRNTVLAEDGKTVVLGGLIGTNIQKTEFKVPLLGDIPLLGRLFRSDGTSTQKTNLLIFITPRVIHDASEMAEITRRARFTGEGFQTEELQKSVNKKALITDINPSDDEEEAPAKDE